MEKSGRKSGFKLVHLLMFILALFLLASCNRVAAGEKPIDTATALKMVQTGTQGIETKLLQNSPPPMIYDQNELIAILEVNNKGNHDVLSQECFVQATGFDKNIIKGGFDLPHSCNENQGGALEGKNVYNVEGGSNQIEFRSTDVSLPNGVFDYTTTLNFVSCYNYQTRANPVVCVDPLFYQVTSQQKNCIPKDVGMGGGQGAPVGVTYVGVQMAGGKAVFNINIQNVGGGRVLSNYADIRNCGEASLEYTDLDKVAYTVQWSSGIPLNCKPLDGFVRLNNNNGKIVCSTEIPSTYAYETPLSITLDYNYIKSFTKQVKIVDTPQ